MFDELKFIGAPVIAIIAGMLVGRALSRDDRFRNGLSFTSKYILQAAVVLLGFGLNIVTIGSVGFGSLPVILCTISASLMTACVLHRLMRVPTKTTALIGVGSSICGGSAIAATAPVVRAEGHEVSQAIAVIFLFNVVAALTFPTIGSMLGMSDDGFALFAGTAINDTSSVTAAASTWDAMHGTGHAVLDSATVVKLTRTLFIIPIVVVLSYVMSRRDGDCADTGVGKVFPRFVLFFVLASLATTVITHALSGEALHVAEDAFSMLKMLSTFLIVMAMAAIGLNTDVAGLVRTGSKPLVLGLGCWSAIILTSLLVQYMMGIW